MYEERIALAVFAGLAGLFLLGWLGWVPRGVRDLLGGEDEREGVEDAAPGSRPKW